MKRLIASAVRVTLASALLAGVSYVVWLGLDDALGRGVLAQAASLGVALAAGALAYLAALFALRVPEADQVLRLIRRV
jgi:putative peptidoglycan lipid II flippase